MSRLLLPFALLLLVAVPAYPAAPIPVAYEPWTIDDVIDQEAVSEVRFSPDGCHVVWVRLSPDKEKNAHVGQLMRTELKTGKQIQLTRSKEACTNPRWSPDGSHISFLSSRPAAKTSDKRSARDRAAKDDDPKTQIWLLDTAGGEH
jgi:dipeptidyl aminopeptidase/acylaminoacyl peptidase